MGTKSGNTPIISPIGVASVSELIELDEETWEVLRSCKEAEVEDQAPRSARSMMASSRGMAESAIVAMK